MKKPGKANQVFDAQIFFGLKTKPNNAELFQTLRSSEPLHMD